MAFQVVDAYGRQAARPGQRLRHAGAHQQRPGQAGSGRSHRADVGHADAGFLEHLAGQRRHAPDMVARGQLRHHAPVFLVHGDLGVQGVRQQSAFSADGRDAGFIAGAFKAENNHGGRVYN